MQPPALVAALCALALGSGCAQTRPAPPGPLLGVTFDHFPGTVLTGPSPESDWEQSAAEPWQVEFRFAYIEALPEDSAPHVSTLARQVFVERSQNPLRTRAELALDVRLLDDSAPAPNTGWALRERAALWAGTTTACRTVRRTGMDDAAAWDGFDLEVSRRLQDPDRVELALVLEGQVVPRIESVDLDDEEQPAQPVAPELQREHLILDVAVRPDGEGLRLFLPLVRRAAPRGGIVVDLRLTTVHASDAAFAEIVRRDRAALAQSAAGARARTADLSSAESFRFERASAIEALETRRMQRATLVFLADATDATLTGDLALLATDEVLADFASTARSAWDDASPSARADAGSFGWFLERTSYRWLAQQAEAAELGLAPELGSLLLRHAGALGRYPDLVLEAVQECADAGALEARFLAENRILLEDTHPAVRVRAYDWLEGRQAAPAGYDPLASRVERRAALTAIEALELGEGAEPEPETEPETGAGEKQLP